jgi:hypothetical protein
MRFFPRVPAERTSDLVWGAMTASVDAYLVRPCIGPREGRMRNIEGRARRARIWAAVSMIASVLCGAHGVQWLLNEC